MTFLEPIIANIQTCVILLQMVCVIIVITYLIMRSRFFTDFQNQTLTWKSSLLMTLLFGLVSIYGTESGIYVFGTQINIRDLGPIAAGLTCGPVVGLGAGIIGGLYRFAFGSEFTRVACTLAAIIAGLIGGGVYYLNRRQFIGLKGAVLIAGCMELIHMGLVLLISRPTSQAVSLVSQVVIPMTLANMAGIAIFSYIYQNMIIERKTSRERDLIRDDLQRKQAELNIARDIQLSFLPDTIPSIKGYQVAPMSLPAREVGGDFYDVIVPVSQDKVGILIADVSGKGVPAALFMALSRTITRANATWHKSAVSVITETNMMICEDARSGMFVTLFFCVLHPDKRTLTFVNAGHNPPLLFREQGTLEELYPTGPALGIMDDGEYTEPVTTLEPDDILVMYTDGVTESVNRKDEEFGVERLESIVWENRNLPAAEIRDAIIQAVSGYTDGQDQFDDITIIVMKGEELQST
ncbi:MAG: SpoIIE family protein phosphatase [Methanospirillum sp.]|uniref:SpoIIE family protein phosphatase n=1 Tax=Methanospirillum sp. TaxID=45200 RepID=UPI00236C625A|nr:SpoIIE family protein phosphatase [Methanospirillum sp.]MDD1727789.1 SpoIIE family protein phosphatase [Methanospirillum sp.]